MLEHFIASSPAPFIAGIRAAREWSAARSEDECAEFLTGKAGFSQQDAARIIATVLHEELRPPEMVFDFV